MGEIKRLVLIGFFAYQILCIKRISSLSPRTLKASNYGGLITKVRNRILNWKSKFLSFGGRKQLIISVLHSLQLYWMTVYVFPSSAVHQ